MTLARRILNFVPPNLPVYPWMYLPSFALKYPFIHPPKNEGLLHCIDDSANIFATNWLSSSTAKSAPPGVRHECRRDPACGRVKNTLELRVQFHVPAEEFPSLPCMQFALHARKPDPFCCINVSQTRESQELIGEGMFTTCISHEVVSPISSPFLIIFLSTSRMLRSRSRDRTSATTFFAPARCAPHNKNFARSKIVQ